MCPFADQVPLELGQRREHMKNQFACCAAGFDFLRQTLKRDALLLQLGHDLHQIRQAAPESIQPPDDKGIPGPQCLAALLKLGAVGRLATGRFLIDRPTPGL
ncbi:hypothetical protein D9M71_734830 [compost metagenome]